MASNVIWDQVQGTSCSLSKVENALQQCDASDLLMDGWTPVHFACENRFLNDSDRASIIRVSAKHKVDVQAVDESGWTALHLLCKNKGRSDSIDVSSSIQQLTKAKANINATITASQKTPLHLLCENEAISTESLDSLLSAGASVSVTDEDENTPFHFLASNPSLSDSLLKSLLSKKPDANIRNNFQETPFHYLAQNASITPSMVSDMLKHKADPNAPNNIGNTPLIITCENSNVTVDILRQFLDSSSVNTAITNSLGKTAFQSLASSNTQCINFMKQHVAQGFTPLANVHTATIGGEDADELPDPALKKRLSAWNDSLPPFDSSFYLAVCCDPNFQSTYDELQDLSAQVVGSPDKNMVARWEDGLAKWRHCVVTAFAALVPPKQWDSYSQQFHRRIPSELTKVQKNVTRIWSEHADENDRGRRIQEMKKLLT